MAEEVVITQDQFGRDVTIPIDENGNIILYRATDDPNRIIDSDFRPLAKDKGSVGLGQQSYFSPNPMYSHKYESSGRKNYKFVTDIKPNQILATDFPVNNYPELVKVLKIPEEYTNQNWRQLVNNDKAMISMGYEAGGKRFFNDNIQTFKDNGIKAFGSISTGTGGQPYIEYEIIPLVKEGDTLGIKPIATLQTKEGFDAGKSPEAFIETSLDTPTNVAGAEVIDEGVDITESSAGVVDEIEGIQKETLERLRNANDAFVDQQLDDIMARKINEVLPFVDTSISRAGAIGIAITGPEVLDSADPVLNSFIKEIEQLTGQSLQTSEKRKLRQFIYDMAKGKDNLLDDKKSFISNLRDGLDNSKLKDPGYKIWKNWQNSGAFIPQTITGMTANELSSFGPPSYIRLLEGLEKSGESIDYKAISNSGLDIPDTPTNVVDDNYIKGSSNGPSRTDKILIETLEDFASYSKIPFSDSIEISKQNQQGVRMSKELGYTEDGFLYLYNSIDSTYQYVDPNDIKKLELFLQENDLIDFLYTNQLYVPFQIDVDKEILTKEEILKLPDIPVNHITEGVSIIRNLKEKYPDELIDLVVDFDNVDGGRINIQSLFIDSDIKEKEIYLDVANELNQLSNKYNVSINVYDDNPIHNFYNIIDQPKNIVGNEFVDEIVNANTQLVNDLPLSTTVKNQFNNLVQGRARNLATPGGLADAVDVWELGVLGLMISAVAYKEYDEIPTILTNKAVDMFNNMTSFYGIPPIPKEEYDLDYERINKIVETGEKFMPTDIMIKKVGDVAKGAAETGAVTGFGYVPPNLTKTDTMETTQKIQPGVQEEKMFEKAKPKKIKSTGGSGAKIL